MSEELFWDRLQVIEQIVRDDPWLSELRFYPRQAQRHFTLSWMKRTETGGEEVVQCHGSLNQLVSQAISNLGHERFNETLATMSKLQASA